MLKTICYISDFKGEESYATLKSIYTTAKANNKRDHITGILVYKNNNFLQVFEGEEEVIDATFKRILKDPRHDNIIVIIEQNTKHRFFEDYNFGFTIVKDREALNSLTDYLDWLRNADHKIVNEIIVMVENFIAK